MVIRVRDLRSEHIEKAGLVWQRAGVKQSMRRKAIEVLRSAFGHAVALGLCEFNPASRVRTPPKSNRTATRLDVDDARKLLDSAAGHSLEASYALAIGLGLALAGFRSTPVVGSRRPRDATTDIGDRTIRPAHGMAWRHDIRTRRRAGRPW